MAGEGEAVSVGVRSTGAAVMGAWTVVDSTTGTGASSRATRWGAIGRITTAASTAHQTAQRVAALILMFSRGRNRRAAQTISAMAALCQRLFSRAAKAMPRMG